VKCKVCDKQLRKDNAIGTCRQHRSLSDSRKSYMNEYAKSNSEDIAVYKKTWATENRDKLNKQQKARLKKDINASLAHALRTRLNRALKGNFKVSSAVSELGCSLEEFKIYLENQFELGMTWDNHTNFGWHIDHIIPLHKLDLSNEEQFKIACHYTNLRPLWWRPNIQRNRISSQE
jgi:hypothetical protein